MGFEGKGKKDIRRREKDESERQRVESQWIVTIRPFYHS